jgi:hypothetical protein
MRRIGTQAQPTPLRKCISNYMVQNRERGWDELVLAANKHVHATRRFTCAASGNRPNCIANEPFNTIAALANDANAAMARRQARIAARDALRAFRLLEPPTR